MFLESWRRRVLIPWAPEFSKSPVISWGPTWLPFLCFFTELSFFWNLVVYPLGFQYGASKGYVVRYQRLWPMATDYSVHRQKHVLPACVRKSISLVQYTTVHELTTISLYEHEHTSDGCLTWWKLVLTRIKNANMRLFPISPKRIPCRNPCKAFQDLPGRLQHILCDEGDDGLSLLQGKWGLPLTESGPTKPTLRWKDKHTSGKETTSKVKITKKPWHGHKNRGSHENLRSKHKFSNPTSIYSPLL